MDFSSINWLAVVVCVVVSMISGSLWYNPKTFSPSGGRASASRKVLPLALQTWA